MRYKYDIILAGIGIGGFNRTKQETLKSINSARIIFHLTHYHRELTKRCNNVVNLSKYYWTGEEDTIVYKRLADIILSEVNNGPGVLCIGLKLRGFKRKAGRSRVNR